MGMELDEAMAARLFSGVTADSTGRAEGGIESSVRPEDGIPADLGGEGPGAPLGQGDEGAAPAGPQQTAPAEGTGEPGAPAALDIFEGMRTASSTKGSRLNMAVFPAEAARWRAAAARNGVSLTSFVEAVLNDFCDRNGY